MTFRFLRGTFGDEGLLEEHRDTIHRILKDDYTEKNIEKLQGHEVYSMKLGDAKRLLFSTIEINGKKYLLILDYLPTHDYHKSRFLKSGVLNQYKDKICKSQKPKFENMENFDAFDEVELNDEESETIVDFYQNKWITLNSIQNEILNLRLPAVVNGSAGSGKSCVALSLLATQVEKPHEDETPRRFLYICQNRELVIKMKEAWLALPIAVQSDEAAAFVPNVVEFKTFDDLIPPSQEIADAQQFSSWFEGQKKLKRKETDSVFLNIDKETLYEEFRICSGYKPEQYIALGERQSLIPRGPQRKELLDALARYKSHLTDLELVDPQLHLFEFQPTYTMVVVDESQDFSHAQIVNLTRLAQHQQIICFMDSHQRLFDRLSIRPFLLEFLGIHRESSSHVQLEGSYRCPARIMDTANQVIHFKHQLVQGIADKYEARTIGSQILDSSGAVHLVKEGLLSSMTWIRKQETQFAIVTSEENKARASKLFGTPLVFSPAEIKGLEYPIILAFELFDETFFKRAYKRWTEVKDKKAVTGRSVEDKDDSFIPLLNAIFTAYTRAEQRLIICEKRTRENNILLELLSPLHQELPQSLEKVRTSILQWEDELKRQVLQGNHEQAQRIFITKLGRLEQDYAAYKADLIDSIRTKAMPTPTTKLALALENSVTAVKRPTVAAAAAKSKLETALDKYKAHKAKYEADKAKLEADFAELNAFKNKLKNEYMKISNPAKLNAAKTRLKKHSDKLMADSAKLEADKVKLKADQNKIIHLAALDLHEAASAKQESDKDAQESNDCYRNSAKSLKELLDTNDLGWMLRLNIKILPYFLEQKISSDDTSKEYESVIEWILKDASKTQILVREALHCVKFFVMLSSFDFTGIVPENNDRFKKYIAFQERFYKTHKKLLEKALDSSIIHHIVEHSQTAMEDIREYVEWGGDIDLNLKYDDTATLTALAIATFKKNHEIIFQLVNLGANINYDENNAKLPMHIATDMGDIDLVRKLHEVGANVNLMSSKGIAPIHIAASNKNIEMIEELLKLGVDINQTTNDGNTVVHIAAINTWIPGILKLSRLNANLSQANQSGHTPENIARHMNNDLVLQTFQKVAKSDSHGFFKAASANTKHETNQPNP